MKRLDHFFLSDNLLQHSDRYRTWVEYPFISDHAPVILQLDSYSHCSTYPFKFNPCWLWNSDFERLVTEVWTDQSYHHEVDVQRRLAWKLKDLKQKVKSWARLQIIKTTQRLSQLELNIQTLIRDNSMGNGNGSSNMEQHIKNLETERNKLLLIEEAHWRQKSRAIWITCGDRNTKYFHQFSSHMRNHKHIWELQTDTIDKITGQDKLIPTAFKYFKNSYSDQGLTNFMDQASIVGLFPKIICDREADLLYVACTKEEIWKALNTFKKDKIPGPRWLDRRILSTLL
jgi:hypothetical protein